VSEHLNYSGIATVELIESPEQGIAGNQIVPRAGESVHPNVVHRAAGKLRVIFVSRAAAERRGCSREGCGISRRHGFCVPCRSSETKGEIARLGDCPPGLRLLHALDLYAAVGGGGPHQPAARAGG